MKNRLEVMLSAAVSIDGYLDDNSSKRLILSSAEDWEEVRKLRAQCDAILVGAQTVRRDNPSLMIRSEEDRQKRVERGLQADIIKVTLTQSGQIDPMLHFFQEGEGRKVVFAPHSADRNALNQLRPYVEIVQGEQITARFIVDKLTEMGCRRLMVEGGTQILTMFLEQQMVDSFRLAVAPLFVGDTEAPRLVGKGRFVWGMENRMQLQRIEQLGDVAVMHYVVDREEIKARSEDDIRYLQMAIDQSRKCTPTQSAYCVGAVIVTIKGELFKGYTHQSGASNHAEEEAIYAAQAAGAELRGATIYSSMEPCSKRSSKPKSCSQLLIEHQFGRVVYAYAEPAYFVDCQGEKNLREAGVEVEVIEELGEQVVQINAHILRQKQS